MNANIITSRVPRLSAISLVLLSTFSFAGRTEAQTSTTSGQGINETATTPVQPKTSEDLGWQPDFGGIKYPITLRPGDFAIKLGLDYTYGDRTRDDVKFTSDRYVPYLEGQIGLPHNLEFDAFIPWITDTITRKDSTGEDSTTHNGIGNLGFGLKQNVVGNDGGTWWGFSYTINGFVGLDNNRGSDFSHVSTQSDNNNNDNTVRRDRNNNNYGLGVSGQFSANLGRGLQATFDSGVMVGHSCCCCCCCCACFDNLISLKENIGNNFALQGSYDASITTARDAKVVSGPQLGLIVKPTILRGRGFEAYVGVKDQLTGEHGDHFGGVLEFSYTH